MDILEKARAKRRELAAKGEPPRADPSARTGREAFVQDVCQQLDDTGVARFWSERLNETIYLLHDCDKPLMGLPEGALVFSLADLQNVATQSYSTEELKELAQAKKEILAAQRQWLAARRKDLPAGVETALKVFPDARVLPVECELGGGEWLGGMVRRKTK